MVDTGIHKIDADGKALSSEALIEKIKLSLRRDGDFPATARLVTELRRLAGDPKTTANQVAELILKEPSLAARVLNLVNSTMYRRSKPIMTVSQAVVQVGMKALADMCAGLVLLQKFVPTARKGGPFASCLQKSILSSLVSSSLAERTPDPVVEHRNEKGYLAGSFAELGTILLAYYFPQVYDSALKRATSKSQTVSQSITDITGVSPLQLSIEVMDELKLPELYRDVLRHSLTPPTATAKRRDLSPHLAELVQLSQSLNGASTLSEAMVFGAGKREFDATIVQVERVTGIVTADLHEILGRIPTQFAEHCAMIDLQLPALPEYLRAYSATDPRTSSTDTGEVLSHYVAEIREAIENDEPTSAVITAVMETIAWGLKFDRVLLLLLSPGKKELTGRMVLGATHDIDARAIHRPLGADAGPRAPDARAFSDSRPVYVGEAILPDGWPIATIPVGFGSRAIGVVYADRWSSDDAPIQPISEQESAGLAILAELLDQALKRSSGG